MLIRVLLLFVPLLFLAACDQPDSHNAIAKRLQPIGAIYTKGEKMRTTTSKLLTLKQQLLLGEKIYRRHCSYCHAQGSAGAPRISNKKAWALRAKRGKATLFKHVKQGYNLMPAKGKCQSCSDQQLHTAIVYMLNQNGLLKLAAPSHGSSKPRAAQSQAQSATQ